MRVLDALHYSHSLRDPDGQPTPIIHRDISGGNVDDRRDRAREAHRLRYRGRGGSQHRSRAGAEAHGARQARLHRAGVVRGRTAESSERPLRLRGDVARVLVGRNEFHADGREAEDKALGGVAAPLHLVSRDVSRVAADAVGRALAKDLRDRFESAAAFSQELRRSFEIDLADARDEFALFVESDFEDPDFSRRMGVLSLRQIDAAWRRHEGEFPTDSLQLPT